MFTSVLVVRCLSDNRRYALWWLTRGPAATSKLQPAVEASQPSRPVATRGAEPTDIGLADAPRLSVVVLPFDNLGGEGVKDETADGITEDLTTDISRLPGFLVIARNTARHRAGRTYRWFRVRRSVAIASRPAAVETNRSCRVTCRPVDGVHAAAFAVLSDSRVERPSRSTFHTTRRSPSFSRSA
jgi:TolB-like protein